MSEPSMFSAESLKEFVDTENALKEGKIKRRRRGTVNHVCLCGHSINSHEYFDSHGKYRCQVAKTHCECDKPKPVLETDNLRNFMYATDGPGSRHALGKGMMQSYLKNVRMQWLDNALMCDVCKENLNPNDIFPIALNRQDDISYKTTGLDLLVCRSCYESQAWKN